MKKMCYTHTHTHTRNIIQLKKKEILPFSIMGLYMEISEISQLQKEKHYLVSYMRNLTESNSWKQRVELAAVRGWGRMK